MTLVTNKDLLLPATREAYAVGAFNISNLESLLAVTEAAVEENSPVVIAVSPTSIDYAGLTYIEKMVKIAAESAPVPMSLHLDHGKDIETVVRCLDAGFTSIMIDGSSLRFEDNVALTKRVVDLARPRNVSVEAELGRIAAVDECTTEEKQSILTDPESAKTFVDGRKKHEGRNRSTEKKHDPHIPFSIESGKSSLCTTFLQSLQEIS